MMYIYNLSNAFTRNIRFIDKFIICIKLDFGSNLFTKFNSFIRENKRTVI